MIVLVELKQAVITMMMKKDEIEDQNRYALPLSSSFISWLNDD